MGFHIVFPIFLARLRIEAKDESTIVRNEQKSVGRIDAYRRNRPVNFFKIPNQTCLRDIAHLRGIDTNQAPDAFTVLGVLTDRHINSLLIKNWRRINFARTFRRRILDRLSRLIHFVRLGDSIKPPDLFHKDRVSFLHWLRAKCVKHSIATPEIDLILPINLSE